MKTIAYLEIDPSANGLGLLPRYAEPLAGVPVLTRIAQRASRLAPLWVVCPPSAQAQVRALTASAGAEVIVCELPDLPQRAELRRRRKWAGHGWRGGIGGGFVFDEEGNPHAMRLALERAQADALLVFSPAAPFVDLELAAAVLDNLTRGRRPAKSSFAAAPPGLAPYGLQAGLVADLARVGVTLGEAIDHAQRQAGAVLDVPLQPESVSLPLAISSCPLRFTWDSDHGIAFLRALGETAAPIEAARAHPALAWGAYPRDLEIELTAESAVACRICPHGSARGLMELTLAERLLDQAAEHDDVRVTFGGSGDPLRHPHVLPLLRRARVFGLHVATQAVDLDAEAARALIDSPLDVLSVCLDAVSPEAYARLKPGGNFARVVANLEGFRSARGAARGPLLVVEFTRTRENEGDLEAFFEFWKERADETVIRDHDPCAGQREDLSPMHLHPPDRGLCRRLSTKLTVRADGSVPLCDEDGAGRVPLGNAARDRLDAIWTGEALQRVRQEHLAGRFASLPLCSRCTVWHGL